MPVASHRSTDIGRPWTRSSLAVISETTKPAPSEAASRRNGASVIPDIGASKTRLATSISPIFRGFCGEATGPVTYSLVSMTTASLQVAAHSSAHISWAVKFHAYTLDSSGDLASAVQQNTHSYRRILRFSHGSVIRAVRHPA